MADLPSRPASGLGHYLRDVVYGALDGCITTFAVVAGVDGARLGASVAIILGVANLVADGISMGASNYLGLKSELEQRGIPVAEERPLRHGAATFLSFVAFGTVPLLAFLLPSGHSLAATAVVSLLVLFGVGALRARFTPKPPWRQGIEMLAVGALAGAAAYLVGRLARLWTG